MVGGLGAYEGGWEVILCCTVGYYILIDWFGWLGRAGMWTIPGMIGYAMHHRQHIRPSAVNCLLTMLTVVLLSCFPS